MPAEPEFHLAFDKMFVDEYRVSRRRNSLVVRFALIPTTLPPQIDLWTFRAVKMAGEPAADVRSDPFGLISVRSKNVLKGPDLGIEGTIVNRLLERAGARGHILPKIVLTTDIPYWSRMQVEGDLLYELRRASV